MPAPCSTLMGRSLWMALPKRPDLYAGFRVKPRSRLCGACFIHCRLDWPVDCLPSYPSSSWRSGSPRGSGVLNQTRVGHRGRLFTATSFAPCARMLKQQELFGQPRRSRITPLGGFMRRPDSMKFPTLERFARDMGLSARRSAPNLSMLSNEIPITICAT